MAQFKRILKIKYNNKCFQVFTDENHNYAFLEYDEINDKYHYPELDDMLNLAKLICQKHSYQMPAKRPKKYKYNFIPAVKMGTNIVVLSASLLASLSLIKPEKDIKEFESTIAVVEETESTLENPSIEAPTTENTLETPSIEEPTKEVLETIPETEAPALEMSLNRDIKGDYYQVYESAKEVRIYNTIALDKFLGYDTVSNEEIMRVVNDNPNIEAEIKPFIEDFLNTVSDYYPALEKRVFYENAKTLKIKKENPEEFPSESAAYYDEEVNTIHLNEDINLTEGSEDILIFRHELGHTFHIGKLHANGYTIICKFRSGDVYGHYIGESLDVLFTTFPFLNRYPEEVQNNMGYPLTTNIVRVILAPFTDYDYSELTRTTIYNFESYLNDKVTSDIDAGSLIDLLNLITNEYYSDGYVGDPDDYAYIYKYIADIYVEYVLKADMSYNEIMEIQDRLCEELTRGLDDTQLVILDPIYNQFNEFIEENNIIHFTY